jgi:predicted Co/Zn/Cd cation transporter (cation efflux family)
MPPKSPRARGTRRVAVDAALLLIVMLLMVQMWLLTATLEAYLAGHHETALPGAVASFVLFLGCAALYWMVIRLDRRDGSELPTSRAGPWQI